MGANVGPLGGGEGVVSVEPGVESPGRPGCPSAVSGPLSEHTDFMGLWLGVLNWMKKGRDLPQLSKLELELQKFFVVGTLAPRSTFPATPRDIPAHKLSPEGQDMLAYHFLHFPERQMREIRCEVMCEGHCVGREYLLFHKDPLCVEAWGESPGQRFAGEQLRAVIAGTVDHILSRAHPGAREPLRIFCNIEDPPNSRLMTVISDPLDGYITFERIWTEWLDLLKYPNSKGGPVKDVRLDIQTEWDFTILQVVDGNQAEALWCGENRPGEEVRDFKKVHANTEARTIYVEHFRDKEDTPRRLWTRFPPGEQLRVQAWAETRGRRHAGEDFAKHVQKMLDDVLTADKSDVASG